MKEKLPDDASDLDAQTAEDMGRAFLGAINGRVVDVQESNEEILHRTPEESRGAVQGILKNVLPVLDEATQKNPKNN